MSPRDAFTLTEAHREYYPRGVFAQERDALAIEALMRSGDMTRAKALAEEFVSAHPNSPHAHRFREAMGLH
jgi:outer membrane protein assembly factor BamD (BamD/ComL family)